MQTYTFFIPMAIRIGDINYGNHVGYQNFFLFFQDARIAYLNQFGYSEMDIAGFPMIVAEAHCKYRKELRLGDRIVVKCRVSRIEKRRFEMSYRVEKQSQISATGTTINMCIDRQQKKIVSLPQAFIAAVSAHEGINVESP